jgi:hypothetical protein
VDVDAVVDAVAAEVAVIAVMATMNKMMVQTSILFP